MPVVICRYQLITDVLTITLFEERYKMKKESTSTNNQPLSLYKSQMIQASKAYIANRIAIEGLDMVKNKRSCFLQPLNYLFRRFFLTIYHLAKNATLSNCISSSLKEVASQLSVVISQN